MAIIVFDEDHMDQLDSVFDDFSRGMAEYAILEQFIEEPVYTADLDDSHLLVIKDIVESALNQNGDYSQSLLSEILSKVDRALEIEGSERPVREIDQEDEEEFQEARGPAHREAVKRAWSRHKEKPAKHWPPVEFGNPHKRRRRK